MFIKQVTAKHFKCFSSIDIKMPELTLLTGANSSGKSSFIHAILAPFQSENFPFYLSPNGSYMNMGDFIEMSYCRKRSQNIEIGLTIDFGDRGECSIETSWILDSQSSLPKLSHINFKDRLLSINVAQEKISKNYILDLTLDREAYLKSTEFKITEIMVPVFKKLEIDKTSKEPIDGFIKSLYPGENVIGKRVSGIDEVQRVLMSSFPFAGFSRVFDEMGRKINFISSFRLAPERTYYQHAKPAKIGCSGENYIDQIIEWERQKAKQFSDLRKALQELKLLTGLHARRMRGGRFEVSVKPGRGGIWSAVTDVGFGISQFLPIAVADIQLGRGSTLIVAQPEIHLHPSTQAALGNYFAKRIKAEKKRYVIETHSEYLINRIRLLIVKGAIDPSNIAVYHFKSKGCDTIIYPVQFSKTGKIEGAPQDFFDTYMMEVMDIAMSAQ